MASWLEYSTPERAVLVRALAEDIVLCSLARHFTLTVPLSTQVYKWVPANCRGNLTSCGEVTCDGLGSRPGEVEILLAASCYRNRDKHRQLWANLGSKASLFDQIIRETGSSLQRRPRYKELYFSVPWHFVITECHCIYYMNEAICRNDSLIIVTNERAQTDCNN